MKELDKEQIIDEKREEQLQRFKKYDEAYEKKKLDVVLKQGPEWEKAIKTFNKADIDELNENMNDERIIEDLK